MADHNTLVLHDDGRTYMWVVTEKGGGGFVFYTPITCRLQNIYDAGRMIKNTRMYTRNRMKNEKLI